jgi:hypothetical protein
VIILPTEPHPAELPDRARLDALLEDLLRLGLGEVDLHVTLRQIDGRLREVVVIELMLEDDA